MTETVRPTTLPPTTQAAEGLPRRRWTTAELLILADLGVFRDARGNEERFELIGGEVVPMSPKGRRHEIVRLELIHAFYRRATEDLMIAGEPQFNLTEDSYTNPDILIHHRSILTPDVRGPDALLVIEIAETSLKYDLSVKAPLYASFSVREYWVINATTLQTRVFRNPGAGGYQKPRDVASARTLTPSLCPELAVCLADLRLE